MLVSIAIVQAAYIQKWNLWWVCGILTVVAALKEFWADETWLEHDTNAGSTLDFACYILVGMPAALLSLWMFWLGVAMIVVAILVAMVIDMRRQNVL